MNHDTYCKQAAWRVRGGYQFHTVGTADFARCVLSCNERQLVTFGATTPIIVPLDWRAPTYIRFDRSCVTMRLRFEPETGPCTAQSRPPAKTSHRRGVLKPKFHYADFPWGRDVCDSPGKFRGSRRNGILAKRDVTGLSQTCRGRHGEVGIVEFGLDAGGRVLSTSDVSRLSGVQCGHWSVKTRRSARGVGLSHVELQWVTWFDNESWRREAARSPPPSGQITHTTPVDRNDLYRDHSLQAGTCCVTAGAGRGIVKADHESTHWLLR